MIHQERMQFALEQAQVAQMNGEVPIGAVLVLNDKIISFGHNQTIHLNDPTAHAEIICIRSAAKTIRNHRLVGATLYVTLEPCIMCYGAIVQARISHVVFGASDPKSGSFTKPHLIHSLQLNHHPTHTDGIMEEACASILHDFFQARRS